MHDCLYPHTHRRHHCEVWVEFFTFLLIWYQWPELLKMFLKLTEGSYCWFPWLVGSIFSLNVKGWETKPYCLALQWLLFQPLWCILFGERILEIISCYVYNLLSISGFCVFFFFIQCSFRIYALTPHFPTSSVKTSILVIGPISPPCGQSTRGHVYDHVASIWPIKIMELNQSLGSEEFVQFSQDLWALIHLILSAFFSMARDDLF